MFHDLSPLHPVQLAVIQGGNAWRTAVHPGRSGRQEAEMPSRPHVGIAFGVALVTALLWAWSSLRDTRALQDLQPAERAALVQRTRENLHDICQDRGRPRDFCRAQAKPAARPPRVRRQPARPRPAGS